MTLHRASGIFLILLSALLYAVLIPAQVEDVYYDGSIRPETLPRVYACLMGLCGIIVSLQKDGLTDFDLLQMVKIAGFLALIVLGVFLMPIFGFEFVAPVLVLALFLLSGERRPLWLAIGVLVIPIGVWLIFEGLLDRLLP